MSPWITEGKGPHPDKSDAAQKRTAGESAKLTHSIPTSPSEGNDFLEAALGYADHGWPVFPLEPGEKRPHGRLAPHGFHDASTDPDVIRQWWETEPEANVGIACTNGLLVLDVDGEDGAKAIKDRHLPATPIVQTGRGEHRYFRAPEDARGVNAMMPEIDVKCTTGYVVAPPSVHPDGGRYEWAEGLSPEDVELADTPDWIVRRLPSLSDDDTEPVEPADPATETTKYGAKALEEEGDTVAGTSEGDRNNRLNEAAFAIGQLVAGGQIVEQEARQALRKAARKSGLEKREITKTLRSGLRSGKDHPRAPRNERPDEDADELSEKEKRLLNDRTDSGNAEIIAHLFGDDIRYDHTLARWLVWDGHRWVDDPDGQPPRMVRAVARWRAEYAYDLASEDAAEAAFKYALRTRNSSKVRAALEMAESTLPIADAGEGWDARPDLLAVANGVLDLNTCQLRDGRRDDRLTRAIPHTYDPTAECPRWRQFLNEIFGGNEDLVEHVHRAVGYALTGEQTEQCFWLLHGDGENGKSTFLETLQFLFGPALGWSTGFSTFAARPAKSGHTEDLANLEYRRFVTASETTEGTRLNESRVKAITGGDTMNASAKYGHERQWQPQLSLWLAVNHLPTVTDDSYAFWRRVRFLPFRQTFKPERDREPGDRPEDPDLKAKLKAEVQGILAWAVDGCRRWREDGLTKPKTVIEAVEKYRRESDPIATFLEDRTVQKPGAFAATGDLYTAYQQWADHEAIPDKERLSHSAFGRRMGEKFERERKWTGSKQERVYKGVGLLDPHHGGDDDSAGH